MPRVLSFNPMPVPSTMDLDEQRKLIFTPSRIPRGVSYSRASAKRGALLVVGLNRRSQQALTTTFGVTGVDFYDVWDDLVELLAEYYGLSRRHPLRQELADSAERFLSAKGLRTRSATVVFKQVEPADTDA